MNRMLWISVVAAIGAALLAIIVHQAMRFSEAGLTWDEQYMWPIVERIAGDDGWSRENLIDYDDTKGPAFFVLSGAIAEAFGDDLAVARYSSIAFFALSILPLLAIGRRARLSASRQVMVAALYVALPYNLLVSQFYMSEPSFDFGALVLLLVFVLTVDDARPAVARVVGPAVVGALLALLLHHRMHAVVFSGAIALVTFGRLGWRCWPWWLAMFLAGLSRLPLYFRWGGLVGESFQARYGIGFRLDSLTYLLMALVPYLIGFLALALLTREAPHRRRARSWIMIGAVAGLLLGLVATPTDFAPHVRTTSDGGQEWERYLGMTASTLRALPLTEAARVAVIAVWSCIGGAALAALALITIAPDDRRLISREAPTDREGHLIEQLAGWIIIIGWALHTLTHGDVFDRYLLPFVLLLPIVWTRVLPRWLLALQFLLIAGLTVTGLARWD